MTKKPTQKETKAFGTVVRIADVPGFAKWLHGQTMPVIEGDPEPFGWAYYHDYQRFIQGLPIYD